MMYVIYRWKQMFSMSISMSVKSYKKGFVSLPGKTLKDIANHSLNLAKVFSH